MSDKQLTQESDFFSYLEPGDVFSVAPMWVFTDILIYKQISADTDNRSDIFIPQ